MAKFLLVYTFIALFHLITWHSTHASPIAIDKERGQLLKDAVEWMTLRTNGTLMNQEQLTPLFINPLHEKYVKSKFYRTFVIAFQKGVLPKLTLQENQACDPAYTKEYKDPFNNSVTWHYQKKFTFDLYAKRDSSSPQLCDYRQGLICNPQTKTCQCPEGSSMSPIDQGSSVKRCLLKQDEICALIDLAHGHDREHKFLADNMYHLAFNLEKPPSCQPGSQCRFRKTAQDYPRCYAVNSGPFYPPPISKTCNTHGCITHVEKFSRSLGQECAIGLYADNGICEGGVGNLPEVVCFNYGPPRGTPNAVDSARKGFCGSSFGVWGYANSVGYPNGWYGIYPLFIGYVHPRTVPLRGSELESYYSTFIYKVQSKLDPSVGGDGSALSVDENDLLCSVSKTEQFEKAWQYFTSLEETPPPGSDYVAGATKAELEAKLQELVDFATGDNWKKKVCKVFFSYSHSPGFPSDLWEWASFKCVQEGSPDGSGNDGKCKSPGTLDTKAYAKRVQDDLDHVSRAFMEFQNEETNYDDKILSAFPEPPCKLELALLPEARNGEVLEGGYCPNGSVCYDDFSDARGIYDTECNLKDEAKQRLVCHDTTGQLGKCEEQHLKGKVEQALNKLDSYAKLEKGQKCYPEFEKAVRSNDVGNMSQYQILNWLGRGILCDKKGGNLECGKDGQCECNGGTCTKPKGKEAKSCVGKGQVYYWVVNGLSLMSVWILY